MIHMTTNLINLTSLQDKLLELNKQLAITSNSIQSNKESLEKKESFLKEARDNQSFYIDVTSRLQQVSDKVNADNLGFISKLVNEALSCVIQDHVLIFNINTKISHNKKILTFSLTSDGVEGSIRSFGGGAWSIIAFTLNFCLLYLFTKGRVLFLDETLPAISYLYLDRMMKFMDEIASKFGVSILLITQQQESAQEFRHLTATKTTQGLVLKKHKVIHL